MKKILIFLDFCVLALLFLPTIAEAQTPATCTGINFTISAQATNSTCQSNGTITVTFTGDRTNISSIEYGLSPTVAGGFSINPQSNNVLTGIPAGSYDVTARAFCKDDQNYSVVNTIKGVVVGGNYTVPVVSLNAALSRKSYPGCPTGIIVLNVAGGNAPFTFNITYAPTGAPITGPVTPTINGSNYTLPGTNWPAGDYKIQVSDACYNAVASFKLDSVIGYPTYYYENYQGFRPDLDNKQGQGSCNIVGWYASSSNVTTNADYQRYFNDGMYEIGAAAPGQQPISWTPWTVQSIVYLNLPNSLNTYYGGTNTISVYTRVKGCTNPNSYKTITTYIKNPTNAITTPTYYNCNTLKVNLYQDYDGVLCYPLTLTITSGTTPGSGTVLYGPKTGWLYNKNINDSIPFSYNGSYTITFTDKNGTTTSSSYNPQFSASTNNLPKCNDYSLYYYISISGGKTLNCYPWLAIETITNAGTGALVGKDTLRTTSTSTGVYVSSPIVLQYNTAYDVTLTFPDGNEYKTTKNVPSSSTSISASLYTYNSNCPAHYGQVLVSLSGSGGAYNYYWPAGSSITVTGPNGFSMNHTFSSPTSYNYYFASDTVPPGDYTVTYDLGGCPQSIVWANKGGYDQTGFGYTSQRTCSGLQITPTGTITYQGTPQPASTFYRIMGSTAPSYDHTVIAPGGSLTLSAAGTYYLGIMAVNSQSQCALARDTIVYTAPPLALDLVQSSAYVCVGASVGNISLSGINGVAPYTYQLWDSLNTTKQPPADITTSGIAHFTFGAPNKTYTVRISDACGNNFPQQIKLLDLNTARIVYTTTNPICVGDTIKLNCVTLGTTSYSWTGPNGYTSNLQNPVIPNAQANATGWYKVTVQPEFCGTTVKDSIYITTSYLSAGLASGAGDQTICVRTAITALNDSVKGGTGTYTYQWQSSTNGTTGWTNIAGATSATYLPTVSTQTPGIYYYRRITTDRCSALNGNPITLTVKSCYAPVNPELMNKANK